ncbi:hypothetical protein [Kaistella sp.]|uniref:hypothetical protein n=1 Tax=Kaistella sp. TaxID=2782235 RepID=UPI0035A0796F
MEGLTVYPKNNSEMDLLQNLLQKMKISFEKTIVENKIILSEAQKISVTEGIEEADKGIFYTEDEAKKIIEQCFK